MIIFSYFQLTNEQSKARKHILEAVAQWNKSQKQAEAIQDTYTWDIPNGSHLNSVSFYHHNSLQKDLTFNSADTTFKFMFRLKNRNNNPRQDVFDNIIPEITKRLPQKVQSKVKITPDFKEHKLYIEYCQTGFRKGKQEHPVPEHQVPEHTVPEFNPETLEDN